MTDTLGHTQSKVVASDATFLCINLHAQKVKYQLTLSRNIDDKRTLQSDWTRGTAGHTELKVVVSDATFPWSLTPCKKLKHQQTLSTDIDATFWLNKRYNWPHPSKSSSLRSYPWQLSQCKESNVSIDSFQRYWWSKNPAIWWVKSILGHYWRTTFFPSTRFSQNREQHHYAPFLGEKRHVNWLNFCQKPKNRILKEFLAFFLILKIRLCQFLNLKDPLSSRKILETSYEPFLRKTVNWPTDILT